jgi:hypothetical protein
MLRADAEGGTEERRKLKNDFIFMDVSLDKLEPRDLTRTYPRERKLKEEEERRERERDSDWAEWAECI